MKSKANLFVLAMTLTGSLLAQTVVPDGTLVKLRLNEALNSGRNRVGQGVSLSVAEDVLIGEKVVIEAGARATGTVTLAEPKKHLGRAGKLDFAPDKVQLADGRMISIRTTQQGLAGKGHGIATGVVTAGIALVFWPAAPLALLIKGKDVDIPAGLTFTSFTDGKFTLKDGVSATLAPSQALKSEAEPRMVAVSISSDTDAADIEIDGSFVGQAPATFNLAAGEHRLVIRHDGQVWERTLRLSAGNAVNVKAELRTGESRVAAKLMH